MLSHLLTQVFRLRIRITGILQEQMHAGITQELRKCLGNHFRGGICHPDIPWTGGNDEIVTRSNLI